MYPVECVVRGYLAGSGWAEYRASQSVCGIPLPPGLEEGDELPEPIFTPAFKAPLGQHDENITFERMSEIVGAADAEDLRDASLRIFTAASAIAEERGILLADSKFEFGSEPSSRDTRARRRSAHERLEPLLGRREVCRGRQGSPGELRQADRARLARRDLGPHGRAPELPADIVERTAARYQELVDRFVKDKS